ERYGIDFDHGMRAALDAGAHERDVSAVEACDEAVSAVLSRRDEERPGPRARVIVVRLEDWKRPRDDRPADHFRMPERERAAFETHVSCCSDDRPDHEEYDDHNHAAADERRQQRRQRRRVTNEELVVSGWWLHVTHFEQRSASPVPRASPAHAGAG